MAETTVLESSRLNRNQKYTMEVKAIQSHIKEVAPDSKYAIELEKISNSDEDWISKNEKSMEIYNKYLEEVSHLSHLSKQMETVGGVARILKTFPTYVKQYEFRADSYQKSRADFYQKARADSFQKIIADFYQKARADSFQTSRADSFQKIIADFYQKARVDSYQKSRADSFQKSRADFYEKARADFYQKARADSYQKARADSYLKARADSYQRIIVDSYQKFFKKKGKRKKINLYDYDDNDFPVNQDHKVKECYASYKKNLNHPSDDQDSQTPFNNYW